MRRPRPPVVLPAAVVAFLGVTATAARADVTLPAIFGDHMVLQAERKVPFWGTAEPGEKVTITAAGQVAETAAGKDGRWRVEVGPLDRRDAFEVTVRGRNTITFRGACTP
jgi:sialate O-acetylesterase